MNIKELEENHYLDYLTLDDVIMCKKGNKYSIYTFEGKEKGLKSQAVIEDAKFARDVTFAFSYFQRSSKVTI